MEIKAHSNNLIFIVYLSQLRVHIFAENQGQRTWLPNTSTNYKYIRLDMMTYFTNHAIGLERTPTYKRMQIRDVMRVSIHF